jgi:hypothetical protein
MNSLLRLSRNLSCAAVLLAAAPCHFAQAQYTPVFYDGYSVSASSFNLNFEGTTRQSGALAPKAYVTNTTDSTNDYHHQVYSAVDSPGQPLLIASDTDPQFLTGPPVFAFATMVSPDHNFKGVGPSGVVGKRITFDLDVGVLGTPNPLNQSYLTAGLTIGAPRTLVDIDDQRGVMGLQPASSQYFTMRFVEDTFAASTPEDRYFLQFFDGIDPLAFRIPHTGGAGTLAVQLDVDDPADGDPWDGVGSSAVQVSINGQPVFNYTKADGGYTDNFITFSGYRDFTTNGLATHTVDNFTVYAFAEPAPVPGDYNENGSVDAADYNVWRDNLDTGFVLPNRSPSETGNVNQADYDFWKNNFTAAPGAVIAAASAVPEPLSASLVLVMATAAAVWRRAAIA